MKPCSTIHAVTVCIVVAFAVVPSLGVEKDGSASSDPVKPVLRLMLPENRTPVMDRIAELFRRQIRVRCGVNDGNGTNDPKSAWRQPNPGEYVFYQVEDTKSEQKTKAPPQVVWSIEPGIGEEGFRIEDGPNDTVRIVGNDERGLLYGVGKFLRTSRYGSQAFTASAWRGASVPEKPIRGLYLATHFHNYYHDAPIAEVERYVEDCALWGINTLLVWYDMHHFKGFDDPKAAELRERLHRILQAAGRIGLSTGLLVVANEGYANSPAEMRADPKGTRGAAFASDICQHKPGGREYLLRNFDQLFTTFKDVSLDYLCIWPYDSGSCGCAKCQPWGSNGFLTMAKSIAELAKKSFPRARIVLSTWFFTPEEWNGLAKAFAVRPDWVDYNLVGVGSWGRPIVGRPGDLPMLAFPDISMLMNPWGGFGASPKPKMFESDWRSQADLLAGGFPYSEGIFEDMNKAVTAQLYWSPKRDVDDIVKEYAAFEYAPEVADDIVRVVRIFEQNNDRNQIGANAADALRILQAAEARLTPQARSEWRWRILMLRGVIDAELLRTKGDFKSPVLQKAFAELTKIYHAQHADEYVRPPK